jgi:hypothetical protein
MRQVHNGKTGVGNRARAQSGRAGAVRPAVPQVARRTLRVRDEGRRVSVELSYDTTHVPVAFSPERDRCHEPSKQSFVYGKGTASDRRGQPRG